MNNQWCLLIVFIIIVVFSGNGQGLFESAQLESEEGKRIEFNGYVRGSVFGGSELFDYSSVFGEFCLKNKISHGNAYLYADVRFRKGVNFNREFTDFQLKEAYVGYQSDKFDLFLGNQIVSWGRTDGFNPTNNTTPNDYFFLTSEMDDQKTSNFMLRIKHRFSPIIDIEIIGIPVYLSSVYRYDLFDLGDGVSFSKPNLPKITFGNGSIATRLNFAFSKIEFSTSYFRGHDPFFGFNVQSIDFILGEPVIVNSASPYLKNTAGIDFSLSINSWILRGEAAFNKTKNYQQYMYIPNPNIEYVVGLEHDFLGVTTILQYIGKYTLDFTELILPELLNPTDPMAQIQFAREMIIYESSLFNRKIFYQQEKTNHAITLLLSKALAYDTWNIELAGYYNITSEEWIMRPKIKWKITDDLSTSLGGNYMAGPDKSTFAYSSPVLNGVFVELKVDF